MTASYPVHEFNGNLAETPDEGNFIRQFKNAGYDSYFIGKWHQRGEGTLPTEFGFDASYASTNAGGVYSHFFPFNPEDDAMNSPIGEVEPIRDVEADSREGDYLIDKLTDKMIGYVTTHDRSVPFFAVLSTYAVHTPFQAKREDIERNETQIADFDFGSGPEYEPEGNGVTKLRQDNAVYAAMVENMDWNVGRLLKALNEAGLDENTIVVFTSDHGGLSNRGNNNRELATTNSPLRAGKGHLYEGGIRVPLLLRWPNRIAPGVDEKSIVVLMDLMPSLLDLTVEEKMSGVDGLSFVPVLNGTQTWDDRTVFFHEAQARPNATGDFPCTALRAGSFKFYHFLETDHYELYDLSDDPSERTNLVETRPDVADRLTNELNHWTAQYRIR
ncbi:MAG: sulfatase-like hydrolase/transferase [Bacteroidales bacterium]